MRKEITYLAFYCIACNIIVGYRMVKQIWEVDPYTVDPTIRVIESFIRK